MNYQAINRALLSLQTKGFSFCFQYRVEQSSSGDLEGSVHVLTKFKDRKGVILSSQSLLDTGLEHQGIYSFYFKTSAMEFIQFLIFNQILVIFIKKKKYQQSTCFNGKHQHVKKRSSMYLHKTGVFSERHQLGILYEAHSIHLPEKTEREY